MKIDLHGTAGFPLTFDPDRLALSDGVEMEFKRDVRRAADLAQVLMDSEGVDPQTELYYTDVVQLHSPEKQAFLDRYGLTYSTVLLPALQVNGEFVKTHGHYHPPVPGGAHEFPEVYTQLHGTLLLMMQKRRDDDPEQLEDCVLAVMTPGYVITIPPGYAHVLINTTSEPTLMAGLYGKAFKPDYASVRARQGLAWYVVAQGGSYAIAPNPRYSHAPALRLLADLAGTPFEPPFPGKPVWQAFFDHPDEYAFLTQLQAVLERFGS